MIPQKQLPLADIFEDCKDILNLTNLSSLLCSKITLTLIKLFRLLFTSITTHPLAEIVNIL